MGGGGGNATDASQIFSEHLNLQYMGLMSCAILLFTMAWSFGTRYMETNLLSKPHYLEMLSHGYRELMILGFLSITLVLMMEFHLLEKMHVSYKEILVFEFAHLMLFAVAVSYIFISVIATFRLSYVEQRWTRTANMNVDQVCDLLQAELDEEAERDPDAAVEGSFLPLWTTIFPFHNNKWEDVEWKVLRLLFLKEFRLGIQFDYSQYMHRKLIEQLLHSLEVKPSTWFNIMGMCMIHHLGGMLMGTQSMKTEPRDSIFWSTFLGWFLLILQFAVLSTLKWKVHKHMTLMGCDSAKAIPRFLRVLDAHIVARDQIQWLPFFADAGKEFLDQVVEQLEIKFCLRDSDIFTQGHAGDSMFFLCKGTALVVEESTKAVLGTLGPGDYAGEMSILLNEPRSKSIKAKDTCVIAILTLKALKQLEKEFPPAVQVMRDFAETRKARGNMFDDQSVVMDPTAGKDQGLSSAAKGMAPKSESQDVGDGDSPEGEVQPKQKKDKHAHLHGLRSTDANQVLSPFESSVLGYVTDFLLLATCFHFSFYFLNLMAFVIPQQNYSFPFLVHFMIVFPTFLLVYFIRPTTTRFFCLLKNAIQKDNDMIAVVVHSMDKVIALRNQIKRTLVDTGMKRNKNLEFSNAGELAKFVFHCLDDDGSGELDYAELKDGLPSFDVYLTGDEFKIITRFMDPDQDESISIQEWSDFMMATEEELSHGGWQEGIVLEKLQGAIKLVLGVEDGASLEEITERVERLFESVGQATSRDGRIRNKTIVAAINSAHGMPDVEANDFERMANVIDDGNQSDVSINGLAGFLFKKVEADTTVVVDLGEDTAPMNRSANRGQKAVDTFESELVVNPIGDVEL